MTNKSWHPESHYSHRNNWLRATVLGANDGLISTASLLMGMAAANPSPQTLVLTGVAALVAGAISMAAGEYISVSSQADTEKADLAKEALELQRNADKELHELAKIYQNRGLEPALAHQVAVALTHHDALDAHARDEIGITETGSANPLQAALASGMAFSIGALLPVMVTVLVSQYWRLPALAGSTLLGLAALGYLSAALGGAPKSIAMLRVLLWGVVALGITYGIGWLFGVQA